MDDYDALMRDDEPGDDQPKRTVSIIKGEASSPTSQPQKQRSVMAAPIVRMKSTGAVLGKLPGTRNERLRCLMSHMNESQLNRYEAFRRVSLPRPVVRHLVASQCLPAGASNLTPLVLISMCGAAKVFLGELIETALEVKKHETYNKAYGLEANRRREHFRRMVERDGVQNEEDIESIINAKVNASYDEFAPLHFPFDGKSDSRNEKLVGDTLKAGDWRGKPLQRDHILEAFRLRAPEMPQYQPSMRLAIP